VEASSQSATVCTIWQAAPRPFSRQPSAAENGIPFNNLAQALSKQGKRKEGLTATQ